MALGIGKKPPIFVPVEYREEIEKLSKAALMDLAWDMALTLTADSRAGLAEHEAVMATFRDRAAVILAYRARA